MNQCRIAITEKCNLKCSYCCMKQKDILDTFKRIKTVYEIYEKMQGYDTIMITGGEPLIDFKQLQRTMAGITGMVSRNTEIYLYTNGIEFQNEDFEWSLRKWFNGINIGLHDPSAWDYKKVLSIVHKIIPVRVLINEDVINQDFTDWCNKNYINYRVWKIGDCHVEEDRYLIRK